MGLDSVELLIGFEEAFGLATPSEAAARMRTPRDVIDYVMEQVEASAAPRCASQRAFHLVRRELMRSLSVPRRRVRSQSRLSELIPRVRRKELWSEIGSSVAASEWPVLVRPRRLILLLALTSVAVAAVVGYWGHRFHPELGAWLVPLGLGSWILAGMVLTRWTGPLRTEFPLGTERVEDLVRWVVAKSPELVMRASG